MLGVNMSVHIIDSFELTFAIRAVIIFRSSVFVDYRRVENKEIGNTG